MPRGKKKKKKNKASKAASPQQGLMEAPSCHARELMNQFWSHRRMHSECARLGSFQQSRHHPIQFSSAFLMLYRESRRFTRILM
eukprot:799502-Amphidinium_carterae.1